MKAIGMSFTDPEGFKTVREYVKPRDPRFRRSDNTATYTGWTLRRDSLHAVRYVRDPKGIDWPPEDAV